MSKVWSSQCVCACARTYLSRTWRWFFPGSRTHSSFFLSPSSCMGWSRGSATSRLPPQKARTLSMVTDRRLNVIRAATALFRYSAQLLTDRTVVPWLKPYVAAYSQRGTRSTPPGVVRLRFMRRVEESRLLLSVRLSISVQILNLCNLTIKWQHDTHFSNVRWACVMNLWVKKDLGLTKDRQIDRIKSS